MRIPLVERRGKALSGATVRMMRGGVASVVSPVAAIMPSRAAPKAAPKSPASGIDSGMSSAVAMTASQ
jgi:hypothetical protein